MTKSILSRLALLLLALITIPTLAAPAAETSSAPDGKGPFVDTDGSLFEDSVAAIWAADVTNGCDPWRFCPEERVTRGEMASFLTRALDLDPAPSSPYEDINDSVHCADIDSIAAARITTGCSPTRFCPGRLVTRVEMAALITRALDLPASENLPDIPEDVEEEYRDETDNDEETNTGDWRGLVEEYFPTSEVDLALRVIECESGGDPNAVNPSSGASGLFQHLPQYWNERAAAAGFAGASVFDPEANIAASAWLVYDAPDGGWSHWVCA